MDKETLSNYGWIVICVLVLAVMIALATPFGVFVSDAIKSTTQGLFDVNQNALNSTGLINIEGQEFDKCDHDYEVTTTTANCTTAGATTYTCKLCNKSYSEEVPAGHKYDDAGSKCTECGITVVEYKFTPADYDAKMGTTTSTDLHVDIPASFEYGGKIYKVVSVGNFSNKSIVSVTIPEGVTSICDQAFNGCGALESVEFKGNTLTKIAYNCFMYCKSLKTVTIPASVTEIGNQAFGDCPGLEEITILGKPTMTLYSINRCSSLKVINVSWSEGEVENFPCPQNPTNIIINYNYTGK